MIQPTQHSSLESGPLGCVSPFFDSSIEYHVLVYVGLGWRPELTYGVGAAWPSPCACGWEDGDAEGVLRFSCEELGGEAFDLGGFGVALVEAEDCLAFSQSGCQVT